MTRRVKYCKFTSHSRPHLFQRRINSYKAGDATLGIMKHSSTWILALTAVAASSFAAAYAQPTAPSDSPVLQSRIETLLKGANSARGSLDARMKKAYPGRTVSYILASELSGAPKSIKLNCKKPDQSACTLTIQARGDKGAILSTSTFSFTTQGDTLTGPVVATLSNIRKGLPEKNVSEGPLMIKTLLNLGPAAELKMPEIEGMEWPYNGQRFLQIVSSELLGDNKTIFAQCDANGSDNGFVRKDCSFFVTTTDDDIEGGVTFSMTILDDNKGNRSIENNRIQMIAAD